MERTTLIIYYPNGARQVVRPNPQLFKGNWTDLAYSIAAQYFPHDEHGNRRVIFEVR